MTFSLPRGPKLLPPHAVVLEIRVYLEIVHFITCTSHYFSDIADTYRFSFLIYSLGQGLKLLLTQAVIWEVRVSPQDGEFHNVYFTILYREC